MEGEQDMNTKEKKKKEDTYCQLTVTSSAHRTTASILEVVNF
jgi:hypothetical protein